MLISTDSPTACDDASRIRPHSARPQGSMRTNPVLPSVCQSPSGDGAGCSSASREIFKTFAGSGTGLTATSGGSTGAVTCGGGGTGAGWDVATFDGGGAAT